MQITDRLSAYAQSADARLADLLGGSGAEELLRESMAYSVFAGGKRLRPALCMAACEFCGGAAWDALDAACALEMIHTYSLIHDDLPALDNDELRRGKPSNHMVYGEANAILAGDGLLSLAFQTAARCGKPEAARAIAEGAFDMVVGQSLDVNHLGGEDALHKIHRLKTGALIKAAVLSGAYCGAPSGADIAALTAYAAAYGMLFQITDDILDAEGDATELGKTTGKDAAEHKLTFVGRYGLAGAKAHAAEAARLAREAMEGFSERAWFFTGLADATLHRRR